MFSAQNVTQRRIQGRQRWEEKKEIKLKLNHEKGWKVCESSITPKILQAVQNKLKSDPERDDADPANMAETLTLSPR